MPRFTQLHLLLALSASLTIVGCKEKGSDTGDTGLNFAGDNNPYDDDGSYEDDDDTDLSGRNMAPTVVISSPEDGEIFTEGDEISFHATISDDADPIDMIQLQWVSDVDGDLDDEPTDSSQIIFTTDELGPGRHVISLEATDTEGEISSSTVMITVEDDGENDDDDDDDDDPVEEDDRDGDGFTTEDGDCNDNDWWSYPGAEEYCDGQDNDCDGDADEDFWGDEESNDVLGMAVDLGELDYDGVATAAASMEIVGLGLHHASDEDWFRFDADDDYYDDIAINVVYTGSEDVAVTLQLYKLDWDTTIPWDEVTGTGELTLSEAGSIWTSDEDNWAIRVLPATTETISCETTYSLYIEA